MTYERKKKFVLAHLADGRYHAGINIIDASNGLLCKGTAYQTLDRMREENLIRAKPGARVNRAWELEYRIRNPWERP